MSASENMTRVCFNTNIIYLIKLCELNTLRELHLLSDLSVSLARPERLSACGGQGRVQTCGRVTPVRGLRAVPPRLSLG